MTMITRTAAEAVRELVIAELEADPGRSNQEIAILTGSSKATVHRIRHAMGDPEPEVTGWEDQPVGPEEHIQARKALGLRTADELLALGREADPFYCGTPRDQEMARWFAGLWEQFSFPRGTHLRRIHYTVSQSGGVGLDGTPYLNKSEHWAQLKVASKKARLLSLVDAEAFTDRRTDPVSVAVFPREGGVPEPAICMDEPYLRVPEIELPELSLDMPAVAALGYDYEPADQPVLVECWIEKSTMADILGPLCRQLHVGLKTGKGTESITNGISLLRRAEEMGKPAHVIYISDLDPQGENMPVVVARQCQWWAQALGIYDQLTVERLALTPEQVSHYGLPQAPDSGDTELDALEALHPGVLAQLVRDAVKPWRDHDLIRLLADTEDEASDEMTSEWGQETSELAAEAGELRTEAEGIIEELRPVIEAANARLAPLRARAADLERRVREAAEDFDPYLPDRPEAEDPDVDTSAMLYDSRRPWLDQLAAYRAAKRSAA